MTLDINPQVDEAKESLKNAIKECHRKLLDGDGCAIQLVESGKVTDLINRMSSDHRFQEKKQKEWLQKATIFNDLIKSEGQQHIRHMFLYVFPLLSWVLAYPDVINIDEYNQVHSK